jgi:ferritin-like metal-binding protein YciE
MDRSADLRKEVRSMTDDKLHQKLVDYVEDAHAMEQSVSKMLDSMISTTDDPEIRRMLEHHKEETEEHERRLRERLDALGAGTSTRKQAQTIATALMKGVGDRARPDKPARSPRYLECRHYRKLRQPL